jgi:hypothetical protein
MNPSTETSADGGFQYNHETYRTTPSPESFVYPVSTTTQLGPVEHFASTSAPTGSVSSVDTESSLLSVEEKAKIVELTSSFFARTSKAIAIRRPSETDNSSASAQTLPRRNRDLIERSAGVGASASASGSNAGAGGLGLSSAPLEFRPHPSTLSSASSSHGSVTPVLDSSAQLDRGSSSPPVHPPLSPTSASISSSRRSIFSNSLVPYGLSSDEEEEEDSSTETEGSAPSYTTAEAGGEGGSSDDKASTSSTPPEQSMPQEKTLPEEGVSLEGAVREAMRSSDELATAPPKTPPPPPPSSENLPTAEIAEKTTPSSADRTNCSSVQVGDTPDTSVSFVDGELHAESISEDVAGEKAAGKEASAAPPIAISTGVAIVVVDDRSKSGTSVAASAGDSAQSSQAARADAAPETKRQPVVEGAAKPKPFVRALLAARHAFSD